MSTVLQFVFQFLVLCLQLTGSMCTTLIPLFLFENEGRLVLEFLLLLAVAHIHVHVLYVAGKDLPTGAPRAQFFLFSHAQAHVAAGGIEDGVIDGVCAEKRKELF